MFVRVGMLQPAAELWPRNQDGIVQSIGVSARPYGRHAYDCSPLSMFAIIRSRLPHPPSSAENTGVRRDERAAGSCAPEHQYIAQENVHIHQRCALRSAARDPYSQRQLSGCAQHRSRRSIRPRRMMAATRGSCQNINLWRSAWGRTCAYSARKCSRCSAIPCMIRREKPRDLNVSHTWYVLPSAQPHGSASAKTRERAKPAASSLRIDFCETRESACSTSKVSYAMPYLSSRLVAEWH